MAEGIAGTSRLTLARHHRRMRRDGSAMKLRRSTNEVAESPANSVRRRRSVPSDDPMTRRSRQDRAFLYGLFSGVPLLVWWLGWFPGIMTSDSIDQLGQARRFVFSNFHPAFHTITIWAVTRIWDSPGAVTLVQVLVTTGLLALMARRLAAVGVPVWLASGSMVAIAALPTVAATTVAIWKDVPYTLALAWTFTELLAMAKDRKAFWGGLWGPLRLGTALGLLMLFRHNGWITVLFVLVALAIGFRHRLKGLVPVLGAVLAVGVVLGASVLAIFPVEPASIEPAEVFVSDVAAVYRHHPDAFDENDLDRLRAVAPLAIWADRYSCYDSTPLAFDPAFDSQVIRDDPSTYRGLVARTIVGNLPTVLGHRWCAASYFFVPPQPVDAFFHRPPFDIPPNTLGFQRSPISDRAYAVTKAIYIWAEPPERLWLTWRPALAIWAGIITYLGIALRRRLRPLLWPGALIAAQLVNAAGTTPAQEFRFAFGVYLLALASLPLLWLVARPDDAEIA